MFIVNVEAAIFKNGEWLLIKRSEKEEHAAGMLSLVGGKVESEGAASHILETTVKREIAEEVGIEVSNLHYVTSSSFTTDSGFHVVNVVFLCFHESGETFAKSPDEVGAVVWIATEQILGDASIPPYLREYIQAADRLIHSVGAVRS